MKRLWTAAAIILALAALCAVHVGRLSHFTGQLTAQLEQAREHLLHEDWDEAQRLVDSAYESWEKHGFYLHTTLRHADIDGIRSSFYEIKAFLDSRDDAAECAAVSARLINQLELLLEAELPSVKNLL